MDKPTEDLAAFNKRYFEEKRARQPWLERRRWAPAIWPFKRKRDNNAPNDPLNPADTRAEETKKPRTWRWWALRGSGVFVGLFLALVLYLAITAPLSKSLEPIAAPEITLLSADGKPIARNGAVVDDPVDVTTLPDHVPKAFLAIEDRRFYSHLGVDPRAVGRALWSNISGSGGTQGGSTITQQLAKISFLTPERSLTRKAREALIAFWMEAWLTKDEILSRYLSNAYFGDNVYGLRAASLHYFYRQPENLKPEQAILLAGLVQAPSRYAPTQNWEGAVKRSQMVRNALVAAEFMTQAEVDALPRPELDVRPREALPAGSYFADWAMGQARELTGESYATRTITTTLDSNLQRIAQRAVTQAGPGKAQVALVAMRPNGEVVAMVGGRDYKASAFNRATQAQRQSGSTFKIFVWLAALQSGLTPESIVDDSPIETGSYRPKNAGEKYRGNITLEEAFVRSSNVVAVRLFNQLGGEPVLDEARNLGVTTKFVEGDPSQALGSASVSLIEMTAAFAGIAANEWPVTPRALPAEEQSWWDWLWNGPQSYSGRVHEDMEQMLRAAVNRGTGRAARLSIPQFGKTGTSQDNRDAVFIGYTGDLVVGVWVGNDDNSPLAGVQGGGLPARIWKRFMMGAQPGSVKQKAKPKAKAVTAPQSTDEEPLPQEGETLEGQIGNTEIRVNEKDGLTISTEVDGREVELNIGGDPRQEPE